MSAFKPSPNGPTAGPTLLLVPIFVALLAAMVLVLPTSPASGSTQSKLDSARGKLDRANRQRGVLTDQIAGLSSKIKGYETQVSALRAEEQQAADRLAAKQSELDQAEEEVRTAYAELKVLAARLKRALRVLSARLVAIYQGGTSGVSEIILTSQSYGDLIKRSTYLEQIQNRDQDIAGRVRDLRNTQRKTVIRLKNAKERIESARDEIAAVKQNLTTARAAVESQQNQLASARSERRAALASVQTRVNHLEEIESDLQARIQAQVAAASGVSTLPAGPMSAPSAAGLIWPVSGTLTSGFGGRSSPGGVGSTNHEGIDIAVPEGTPIRAAKGGTVILAAYTGGYGNYTCIDHGSGLSTCYAHQSSYAVSSGQRVSQGQVIGYSGNTGASTGPHLHFEVRINGVAQDPTAYL